MRGRIAAAVAMLTLVAGAAAAETSFRTDVPAGRWRVVRLRAVPEGTRLAVQVSLAGTIDVALVRGAEAARALNLGSALFRAPVDRKLSFSVTAPATGDYYVVLDNRRGTQPQSVELVLGARRPDGSRPPVKRTIPDDATL